MTRRRRLAHTLVEMLLVFALAAMTLVLLYQLYYTVSIRYAAVSRRVEGEMAVRILMTRIRQELRHAIRPVEISNFGVTTLAIPLLDPSGSDETPSHPRLYYSKYTFDQEKRQILYERWPATSLDQGEPLQRRIWMGGETPVRELSVEHTGENERILFQYYRVIVRVAFFDVKIKKSRRQADGKKNSENLIHVSTTVYPRRVNQELRIEVPQEGGFL
jgi:hypothetical protein